MMIDKKLFYDNYRKEFGDLKQSVVDCCDAIIEEFNKHQEKDRDIEKKAYMLSTVRHEVGSDMIPIVENMNYTAKRITEVWPSRFKSISAATPYAHNPKKLANKVYGGRLGNEKDGINDDDGYDYRGRGIGAQFTGQEQYEKWGKIFGVDLVNNPQLAVDLNLGAKILYKGSIEGLFTGVSLSKYINSNQVDYVNARRVINADVARNGSKIANDARKFELILRRSLVTIDPDKRAPSGDPIPLNKETLSGNTGVIYKTPFNEPVNSQSIWGMMFDVIRSLFKK